MFEHCAPQSPTNQQFLRAVPTALGIMLFILLPQDCGMLCQDLSLIVKLLVLYKNVLRHICLNLPLIKCNLYPCLSHKAPENGSLDQALYKCFIINPVGKVGSSIPGRVKPMPYKSDTRCFLSRRSTLLGQDKDWLTWCQDYMTERDIKPWCWWSGLPVGQYY